MHKAIDNFTRRVLLILADAYPQTVEPSIPELPEDEEESPSELWDEGKTRIEMYNSITGRA